MVFLCRSTKRDQPSNRGIHSFAAANSFAVFVKHFASCFIHKILHQSSSGSSCDFLSSNLTQQLLFSSVLACSADYLFSLFLPCSFFFLCNMPCLVLSYAMPDAIYSLYDFVLLAFTCFGGNAVVSKKIVKHFY